MKICTLKQYRQLHRKSAREMAYLFGISREYYHTLESGQNKPGIDLVFKIRNITGIETKYLLDQKKYL